MVVLGSRPPGAAQHGRGRWVAVIVVSVLVAIGGGIAAVALRSPSTPDTPRGAVEAWLAAAAQGDADAARALTCPAIAAHVEQDIRVVVGATWKIMGVVQTDDTAATVTIAFTRVADEGPQLVTAQWEVVKDGGVWRVCGYGDI